MTCYRCQQPAQVGHSCVDSCGAPLATGGYCDFARTWTITEIGEHGSLTTANKVCPGAKMHGVPR